MAIWLRGIERWYLVLGGVAVGRGFEPQSDLELSFVEILICKPFWTNFLICFERIRWMKLSLTPKIIIIGDEENDIFVNYMLIWSNILIFKANDNRYLNFVRFIRFADEKFKTEGSSKYYGEMALFSSEMGNIYRVQIGYACNKLFLHNFLL
jgi:hypothetical protein